VGDTGSSVGRARAARRDGRSADSLRDPSDRDPAGGAILEAVRGLGCFDLIDRVADTLGVDPEAWMGEPGPPEPPPCGVVPPAGGA